MRSQQQPSRLGRLGCIAGVTLVFWLGAVTVPAADTPSPAPTETKKAKKTETKKSKKDEESQIKERSVPRDPATGQATGKRQFEPFVIK